MNTPVWRGLAQTGGIHFYQNLRDFTNQIKQTRLSGHSKGKENAEISLWKTFLGIFLRFIYESMAAGITPYPHIQSLSISPVGF